MASIALHGGQYASLNEVVQAKEKEKIIDAEPKPEPKPEAPPVTEPNEKFVSFVKKLTERFMECKTTQEVVDLNNKHMARLKVIEEEDPKLFKSIHNYKNQKFEELRKE